MEEEQVKKLTKLFVKGFRLQAKLMKSEDVPIMPPEYFKQSGIIWDLEWMLENRIIGNKKFIIFDSCQNFRG